ncbi:MAG: response regulator transcription factor [Anaerolineae bacterium]|jgi:two-component system KDP operon response regulator KdpE
MDQRILLIEDDAHLARLIGLALGKEGYQVTIQGNGTLGLETAEKEQPDLVVLDIMLPGLDGWEVCRRIKASSNIPVLILTARVTEDDVLKGFSCGADDYLRKPFSLAELRARIASLLRRSATPERSAREPSVLTNLDLVLDVTRHQVHKRGQPLGLTPKEYRLLSYFLRNPGRLLTYEELLTQVWGPEHKDQSVYLRVYVRYLRQKLGDDPNHPTYITNVRGEGYRFREP